MVTRVDVDDFDCPQCEDKTKAELNLKTGKYNCLNCNGKFDGK